MSLLTIFLLAIGLAMDAFAVSIGLGIGSAKSKLITALKASFMFGIFQSVMPILGWLAGNQFKVFITDYDHWVAFAMLALIGIKMIYESMHNSPEDNPKNSEKFFTLFLLAIATSIDALAVGVGFAFLDILITLPVIIIGCVCFVFSFVGVEIGNRVGYYAKSRAEIVGGLILIGLGVKILIEHIYFA